jgi:hypothetical protein
MKSLLEGNAMCDLAYVNLLREKVRQAEIEAQRSANFGTSSSPRFVPWILPAASPATAPDSAAVQLGGGSSTS